MVGIVDDDVAVGKSRSNMAKSDALGCGACVRPTALELLLATAPSVEVTVTMLPVAALLVMDALLAIDALAGVLVHVEGGGNTFLLHCLVLLYHSLCPRPHLTVVSIAQWSLFRCQQCIIHHMNNINM